MSELFKEIQSRDGKCLREPTIFEESRREKGRHTESLDKNCQLFSCKSKCQNYSRKSSQEMGNVYGNLQYSKSLDEKRVDIPNLLARIVIWLFARANVRTIQGNPVKRWEMFTGTFSIRRV